MKGIAITWDAPLQTAHSLLQCAIEGYWFCARCERVMDNVGLDHNSPTQCPKCHKRTCHWHSPSVVVTT